MPSSGLHEPVIAPLRSPPWPFSRQKGSPTVFPSRPSSAMADEIRKRYALARHSKEDNFMAEMYLEC